MHAGCTAQTLDLFSNEPIALEARGVAHDPSMFVLLTSILTGGSVRSFVRRAVCGLGGATAHDTRLRSSSTQQCNVCIPRRPARVSAIALHEVCQRVRFVRWHAEGCYDSVEHYGKMRCRGD